MKFPSKIAEEFAALVNALGWKNSEVAAAMKRSEPYVSQVLSGKTNVSEATLEHLKLYVALKSPESLRVAGKADVPREVNVAADELREIYGSDPAAFEAARGVISALHRTAGKGKKPKVNSEAEDAAESAAPGALKEALHGTPKSAHSQKAGGPSERKQRPKRGAGGDSTSLPESPTQAPK